MLQAAWDLYGVMWGKLLQDVVQKARGQQEYLPVAQLKELNISWLGLDEKVLLFRQEYITTFDSLGLESPKRRDSVIVTGHSGIGELSANYSHL